MHRAVASAKLRRVLHLTHTIPAWWVVALALPVLLLGEWLVRRIPFLSRFNIPAPVVGGLLIAGLLAAGHATGWFPWKCETGVTTRWWTWLVTIGPDWVKAPTKNVNLPFLVAFFTCVGLNASWSLVRKGSGWLLLYLGLSAVLAVAQNVVGVPLAAVMGESPLLGLVCGSLTLTGGIGTALGFAPEFEKAGLASAAAVSVAAATFGLVAGGLLGGPLGGWLIRRHGLRPEAGTEMHLEAGATAPAGVRDELRDLVGYGRAFAGHALLLVFCLKAGAWVSHGIQQSGLTFPVYMGAMVLGLVLRNVADLAGVRWINPEIVDTLASVSLGVFLSVAMMSLNLAELAGVALPMLAILAVQVLVMAVFAVGVTFPLMGRSYDAAVMAAGQIGFGLGATPNAVANMKTLVDRFGPSPRAFLVVPVVGGFLIDLVNAVNITVSLNLLKP